MKADLSLRKIKNSFLVVTASTIVFSCGSFQSASYFESDGIYVSKAQTQQERPQETAGANIFICGGSVSTICVKLRESVRPLDSHSTLRMCSP